MLIVQILAEEAKSGSPVAADLVPMLTTLVVFGLAFWVLSAKVWPKIMQGLDDREAKIRSGIEAAEQAKAETEAKQAEFERQLAEARDEADRERAQLRANFQQYREELKAQAEAEVTRLKARAMREIDSARTAAVTELHSESARLATAIAEKILQRQITPEDQQTLIEESLRELADQGLRV